MKHLNLILVIASLLISGYCFSQKKSVQTNTVPIKYVGKYNLKKLSTQNNTILYDCFEIYEKDGKILCNRDLKNVFPLTAEVNVDKQLVKHFDCEVLKIDEKSQKITIKFLNKEYDYKFIKNKNGNFEIVIVENALVYEKK